VVKDIDYTKFPVGTPAENASTLLGGNGTVTMLAPVGVSYQTIKSPTTKETKGVTAFKIVPKKGTNKITYTGSPKNTIKSKTTNNYKTDSSGGSKGGSKKTVKKSDSVERYHVVTK